MTQIGALLKVRGRRPVLRPPARGRRSSTPGLQYDCTVTETRYRPNAPDEELDVIPACDATLSRIPCWHIEEDLVHCSYTHTDPHEKLVIERGGVIPRRTSTSRRRA